MVFHTTIENYFPPLEQSLKLIINQSLTTGIFPTQLKMALVLPLNKKDKTARMENYRPVSLLSSISKLFERVAYNQLNTFFSDNELFFESQYGFRAQTSVTGGQTFFF